MYAANMIQKSSPKCGVDFDSNRWYNAAMDRERESEGYNLAKKKENETKIEPDCRTKIIVFRVFGEQNILELYAEYVAEKVRSQRRITEAENIAG